MSDTPLMSHVAPLQEFLVCLSDLIIDISVPIGDIWYISGLMSCVWGLIIRISGPTSHLTGYVWRPNNYLSGVYQT